MHWQHWPNAAFARKRAAKEQLKSSNDRSLAENDPAGKNETGKDLIRANFGKDAVADLVALQEWVKAGSVSLPESGIRPLSRSAGSSGIAGPPAIRHWRTMTVRWN